MSKIIVGIDTGGTFTDGFFSDGVRVERVKVDTTPHDLTVCFIDCLKEGAKTFGIDDLGSFLKEVRVVRLSSTVATNVLVTQGGSKPGLLVTKGAEDSLCEEEAWSLPEFLITRDLVAGVDEKVNAKGTVTKPVDEDKLLEEVKRPLDLGARILVISFHNSHINPESEKRAKEILNTYYPKHYLGSLPIILASQFCTHPDEQGRRNLCLLDAYVHPKVSGTLYKAEDKLRDLGYRRPLLVGGNNGGCSRVAKTKATDTIGSSPVAGYWGALYWARKYDITDVVTIDIGGTSLDIGLIVNGEISYGGENQLFGLPVATPLIDVSSLALGGGSIAKANLETKKVEVGPESAGAIPGPACYDLGGEEATVTDADVVLRRIDPRCFLGGRRILNSDKARAAIQDRVATPLGLDVEEAALRIVDRAAEIGAAGIKKLLNRVGKSASDFVLFAYGGAGPTHCCEVAERLGISQIYTFPFSSTFGAFGTSIMDVTHVYMHSRRLYLIKEGEIALDIEAFNSVVKEEQAKALRDMAGEGFAKENISWGLDLELKGDNGPSTKLLTITCPKALLSSVADIQTILEGYRQQRARLALPEEESKNIVIEVFYVKASCPLFKYEFPRYTPCNIDPSAAFKTERPVLGKDWPSKTKVYSAELLKCGNVVTGPAILESSDTTFVIPGGWKFSVDEFLNGVIEKQS